MLSSSIDIRRRHSDVLQYTVVGIIYNLPPNLEKQI